MANEIKVTKKQKYQMLFDIVETSVSTDKLMLQDFIEHEIELLDNKKNSKSGSKASKENEAIKDLIIDFAEERGEEFTLSELMAYEPLRGQSNQKLSSLCTQLWNSGNLYRAKKNKKQSYYSANEIVGEGFVMEFPKDKEEE